MDKNIQSQIDQLKQQIATLEANPTLLDHFHNGFDTSFVNFQYIANKKFWVDWTIPSTNAATATNYGVFWIAPMACNVTGFMEVHQTAGTDGSAVTLMLEKLTSGVAPDSGVSVLTTALSLKTTLNVVQSGVITVTLANRTLAKGDRLCLKDAGTLTAVNNVTVLTEITIL